MKPKFMVTIPLAALKQLKRYSVQYLQLERGMVYTDPDRPEEFDCCHSWYNKEIARVRKLSGRISKRKN